MKQPLAAGCELSPPHLEPLPETVAFFEPLVLGEDLSAGVDLLPGEGVVLGLGFAVLVTVRVGAWVTSNCTSVGAEPRAAANTW